MGKFLQRRIRAGRRQAEYFCMQNSVKTEHPFSHKTIHTKQGEVMRNNFVFDPQTSRFEDNPEWKRPFKDHLRDLDNIVQETFHRKLPHGKIQTLYGKIQTYGDPQYIMMNLVPCIHRGLKEMKVKIVKGTYACDKE